VYRYVAITSDWLHLVAAAVWAGGIGQLALTWVPRIFGRSGGLRRAVMREVLSRFGRIAMPAFIVVAISGSVNAMIRLGKVPALWETTYGRVLFIKISLIGLIAIASYLHAIKLRPRLLASIRPQLHVERHHWRLIGTEPLLIAAAIAAVAVLVAFPLPPGQTPPRDGVPPAEARAPDAQPIASTRSPGQP
jgi:putative copper export protein